MPFLISFARWSASALLGLFVVWQAFFLISSNLLRMADDLKSPLKEVPFAEQVAPDWLRDKGRLHEGVTWIRRADKRWSELTAQPQSWSLFAPTVAEHITFPVVELRWDDPRVTAQAGPPEKLAPQFLRSDNEPPDRLSYFRIGRFRLRRFEGNVVVVLATRDRPMEELTDQWRGKIETHLREEGDCVLAYLRRRSDDFQRAHPETPPPRQVILNVRVYRVPPPPGPEPWDWERLHEAYPVVRWLPGAEPQPDYYPLEMYNPVMERFEVLRRPR